MAQVQRRRRLIAAGGALLTAGTLSACLQNPNANSGGAATGGQTVVDNANKDDDKVVKILGAFGGDEQALFEESLKEFETSSGIDVQYTANSDFTTIVKTKVSGGDSPDIALFPQPGGLIELAAAGKVQPIDTYLDYDALDASLIPGFLDFTRHAGRSYGAPMRMAVKSIVWYPKPAYEETGQSTEPTTLQDLTKATDAIKAKGTAPWCMGWGSDAATGWVGTDWLEEYVLRVDGPAVYDQWVSHQIPFDDPQIVKALAEFGKLAKTPDNVFGGAKNIINTKFGDAMTPAFQTPPKCYLMRQGNFASGFLPKPVQADLDNKVGIFVFPRLDGGYNGQPILGGGDLAALFNGNDKDSIEVMKFLTSNKFGAPWAKAGGWLSPHKTFDGANYPNDVTRQMAKIVAEADVFRFDASDLMPKEVGSGTFWTEMVKWMGGQDDKTTLANIEKSWPKG
ncbi:MAG: extracellular solute-binding protein [Tetrasphaera sp.]